MQQRCGQRAQRHQPEQDERGGGHQESIQRIGRVDGCERHRRAGGGENRRDVGDRQSLDGRDAFLAAGPFAGGKQRQREQAAQDGAHAGAEQAGLDRIADHEEPAERASSCHTTQRVPSSPRSRIGLRRRRGRRTPAISGPIRPASPRQCDRFTSKRRRLCTPQANGRYALVIRLRRNEKRGETAPVFIISRAQSSCSLPSQSKGRSITIAKKSTGYRTSGLRRARLTVNRSRQRPVIGDAVLPLKFKSAPGGFVTFIPDHAEGTLRRSCCRGHLSERARVPPCAPAPCRRG